MDCATEAWWTLELRDAPAEPGLSPKGRFRSGAAYSMVVREDQAICPAAIPNATKVVTWAGKRAGRRAGVVQEIADGA